MKEQLNRIIAGLIALLVISSPMLVAIPHAAFASSSSQMGIMIPLYTYPTDSSWTTVINVKNAHPNVPMIVIADVSGSGAGTSIDSNFLQGINNLKAAGIIVLGYDDTAYGSRAVSQVETEASNWYNWYHVNGIFFDEMNNVPGGESYYSNLSSYVKSLGMTMTVGNPGTTTLTSYVGTVDNIVIYESTGLPSLSLLLSSVFNGIYAKSDFSFISYSVSSMPSSSYLSSASNDVEYLYITNAGGSNPYDVLPSYFSTEVADLDTGSTTSTSPSAPTGLTATAGNAQVSLSWTVPSSNGGSAITGYNVYRGTTSGGENTAPIVTSVTATTYTDTGLTNGQTYYYTVKAVNAIGTSSSSNEASAIPVASTAVPGIPTGLSATAISSSQINLSWTAPSNNGGSAITGYEIQRSTNGGSTWNTVVSNTGTTGTTYSDTGLSSSTTYTYQVSAINSVGTSSPSNTASATTNSSGGSTSSNIVLNNVQSTSGTVSASPYQISLSNFNVGTGTDRLLVIGVSADNSNVASVTFGGISLTKAVSSFNNEDAEFWYLKNPTGTGNVVVTMSGSTSAVVGAYAFSGVNQTQPIPTHVVKHNTSASSPAISITTKYPNDWVLDLPSIYGGVTLGSPSCTQEWNVNMPNAITGASSTSVVSSPTAYTCNWIASGGGDLWDDAAIEVRADSSSGSTTATSPGAPTGLTAAAGNAQISLSWTAPSNNGGSAVTGYEIERSTNGSAFSVLVQNTGTTGTTYSDTGLSSSTTYTYRVSAINSVGTSSPSNTASATTNSSGGSTMGGIVLNNIQSASGTLSSSPHQITISNFNAGTGNDRLLVVGVSANNNVVSSITFGSVPLTQAVSSFNNNDAEFWYLKNPTGTGNVVVTMSGSTSAVVGAYAFSGVNQTQPIPTHVVKHNTSASSPAISITTKYPNDWVLDLPSIYGGVTLGSPSCTQEWNVNMPNAITGASSTSVVSSPTAYTCNWIASGGGDLWDDAAIEVRTISP